RGGDNHHGPRAERAHERHGRQHQARLVPGPDCRPAGRGPRPPPGMLAPAAGTALSACSAAPPPISSPPPASTRPHAPASRRASPGAPRGPAWLLTRSALAQLLTDPVVRDELRSSRIYEILQPGQPALAGVTAEPVVTFASAVALENAVSRGQV